MRLKNQIIVEWTLVKHYEDVSFVQRLEHVIKAQNETLKEGEVLEIHQIIYVGEFNQEKVYIIILNIIPEK